MVILGDFFLIFFPKWDFAERWGFLHYNQCIKTLHLSYQTPPYNDFPFSAKIFLKTIFQTPGRGGSKTNFPNFLDYFQFYYGRRHLKPWAPETYPLY